MEEQKTNEKMNLGISEGEHVIEMDIERLRDFKNHPFKVLDDESMAELKSSIEQYGILNPLIVRSVLEGYYEIISGHRRRFAARALGYRKIPVIIRYMKDNEAVVAMVDSNFQRENLKPSEKAFAYKMKYEALRWRPKSNGGQIDYKPRRKRTVEILSEQFGDSPKQVQRYVKVTNLIPELMEKLDEEKIAFGPSVELAYLKEKEQKWFLEAMDFTQAAPSLSQAQRIKKLSMDNELTLDLMKSILGEVKRDDIDRVTFKTEQLRKFFPENYTTEMMKLYARPISSIPFDRVHHGTGRRFQSDVYICRKDQAGKKLDKAAMFKCSKAVGHNRLSVVADNYLGEI